MRHPSLGMIALVVIGTVVLAAAVTAQTPAGLWGSSLYRVELQVSGGTVSGTFTSLVAPQAPPGRIAGRMEADGRAFTADWTFTAGEETGTFKTWLNFADRDGLLTGYRWTEEALPTAFSLHRAVDGQLVEVFGEEQVDDGTAIGAPTPPGGTPPGGGTQGQAPSGTPVGPSGSYPGVSHGDAGIPGVKVDVITCESVVDGEPINIGEQFTAPKSITALVRYWNLPENSTVDWLWSMDGRTEAKLNKTLGGNGWYMHGLRSETAIIPGAYELVVAVNGRLVTQRTITVRAAGTTPGTVKPPTSGGTTSSNPNIDVIVCQSAADGEPVNPGTQFANTKSLACLVKYRSLPENSELKWVWQLPSGQTKESVRAVKGTGWAWHGLNAEPAMSPGTYKVTVFALGKPVSTVTVTVR